MCLPILYSSIFRRNNRGSTTCWKCKCSFLRRVNSFFNKFVFRLLLNTNNVYYKYVILNLISIAKTILYLVVLQTTHYIHIYKVWRLILKGTLYFIIILQQYLGCLMQYRVDQKKNTKQLFNIITTSMWYIYIYGESEVTEKSMAKNHSIYICCSRGNVPATRVSTGDSTSHGCYCFSSSRIIYITPWPWRAVSVKSVKQNIKTVAKHKPHVPARVCPSDVYIPRGILDHVVTSHNAIIIW